MERPVRKVLYFMAAVLIVFGCATQKPKVKAPGFEAVDLSQELKSGKYMPKVDSYVIILDASQSMRAPSKYEGFTKFEFAKEIISRLNETLPDMDVQGALRTFGHGDCLPNAPTLAIEKLQAHNKKAIQEGLGKVACDGGPSPLHAALTEASKDLADAGGTGNMAVILFSDGLQMDDRPIQVAQGMRSKFGDRLCIYAVQVGDSPEGLAFMQRLAGVTNCAPAFDADEIASGPGMAQFVKTIFLAEAGDADGDGVGDPLDACPGTPRGVKVDSKGCPLDSDGDGVPDYLDACPDTPKGVAVDKTGCSGDADGDGVPDYKDKCPGTPKGVAVDWKGCPLDSDNDGVPDDKDRCPNTAAGVPVDKFGCALNK